MRTIALATLFASAVAAQATVTAQWEFNGDLNASIGGTPLEAVGPFNFTTEQINGQQAGVARFENGTFFRATHNIAANGGGQFVNQYTLVLDVFIDPTGAENQWFSILQTGVANTNDGDWFGQVLDVVNPPFPMGFGISGDYQDAGNSTRGFPAQWMRLALVIDTTSPTGQATYRSFVNGVLQNQVQTPSGWGRDGRFSLGPVALIFADEDRETKPGFINSLQFRSRALTDAEVAALGGPSANGIPSGGGPETFRPASFNIVRGALESGDLAAVLQSDDVHLRVRNGAIALPAESPVTVDFVGTSPSAAASALGVKLENRVSIAGLAQRIQMRRYEGTPGFVQVDELIPAPTTDTTRNAVAPAPQADFIQDSDRAVTARLLVRAAGPLFTNTWRTIVDQVEFTVTP